MEQSTQCATARLLLLCLGKAYRPAEAHLPTGWGWLDHRDLAIRCRQAEAKCAVSGHRLVNQPGTLAQLDTCLLAFCPLGRSPAVVG